ncbi:MAG TPA: hypothetical protein VL945_02555, partial [Candidatus Saccharimonadales bacterium]|nr:hypothetical protein [Candidatus Saccharimonadales bacterium]
SIASSLLARTTNVHRRPHTHYFTTIKREEKTPKSNWTERFLICQVPTLGIYIVVAGYILL